MPLTFKTSGGSDFKGLPAGTHIAVCNLVADVGIQPGSGMFPAPKHQIYVRFEVPAERISWEKDNVKYEGPQVIGQFFTASMNEKANLRKQLESWRGVAFTDEQAEAFDVSTILGKPCMLSVVEKPSGDKVYSNIKAISGLPKGIPAPNPENDLLYYAPDEPAAFKNLPKWLQEKIEKQVKSEEKTYQQPNGDGSYNFGEQPPVDVYEGQGITDEDIPF